MNYIENIKIALAKELDWDISQIDEYTPLLDLYVLLALTVGKDCTLEHIHDAWSVWCNNRDKQHRSLKPFAELTPDVQELDRKYRDAVVKVAPTKTDEQNEKISAQK